MSTYARPIFGIEGKRLLRFNLNHFTSSDKELNFLGDTSFVLTIVMSPVEGRPLRAVLICFADIVHLFDNKPIFGKEVRLRRHPWHALTLQVGSILANNHVDVWQGIH